jgi:2-oxoadipate dioxygenase/decarboxylase-like protein
MERDEFFEALWEDFVEIAPQAADIRERFLEHGEAVVDDHVAFRTFNRAPLGLDQLEPLLLELGYRAFCDYRFTEKKLRARAYLCPGSPRIFLSELLVDELSAPSRQLVESCVIQARRVIAEAEGSADATPSSAEIFCAGRLWNPIRFSDYERLAHESEYAAWLCALGLHANHFTLNVNAFKKLTSIEAVLSFVESAGYAVNTAGGRVKGSPALMLEQGSTLADQMPVPFAHGERKIPTCYYEFALRYPDANGSLFEGFVETSANRIFESTDRV